MWIHMREISTSSCKMYFQNLTSLKCLRSNYFLLKIENCDIFWILNNAKKASWTPLSISSPQAKINFASIDYFQLANSQRQHRRGQLPATRNFNQREKVLLEVPAFTTQRPPSPFRTILWSRRTVPFRFRVQLHSQHGPVMEIDAKFPVHTLTMTMLSPPWGENQPWPQLVRLRREIWCQLSMVALVGCSQHGHRSTTAASSSAL